MESMQKRTRILVLGDTHVKDSNREVIEQAIEHLSGFEPVDFVVHLGDFWDKASGLKFEDLEIAAKLLDALIRLASSKVILLQGNHDLRKGSTHGLDILGLADKVEVITSPETIRINGCSLVFLPYGVDKSALRNLAGNMAFGHLPLKGFRLTAVSSKVSESGFDPKELSRRFHLYFGGHHHIYEEKRNIIIVGSFLPTRRGEPSTCKYVLLEVCESNAFWKSQEISYQIKEEGEVSKTRTVAFSTPEDVFTSLDEAKMMLPHELRDALLRSTEGCVRQLVEEVCTEVGTWS